MVKFHGGSLTWRLFNAEHWGTPQSRYRLFIVVSFGEQCASQILFKRKGLSWYPQKSRAENEDFATTTKTSTRETGQHLEYYANHPADSRVTRPYKVAKTVTSRYGTGGGNVPFILCGQSGFATYTENKCAPLIASGGDMGGGNESLVVYAKGGFGSFVDKGVAAPLCSRKGSLGGGSENVVVDHKLVRKLMPIECERLQGLPDGWTEGISDTARYRCIGNSIPTQLIEYIIGGIANVDKRTMG